MKNMYLSIVIVLIFTMCIMCFASCADQPDTPPTTTPPTPDLPASNPVLNGKFIRAWSSCKKLIDNSGMSGLETSSHLHSNNERDMFLQTELLSKQAHNRLYGQRELNLIIATIWGLFLKKSAQII